MQKIALAKVAAFVGLFFGATPCIAGAMSANNFQLPSKDVAITCAPLPYVIHCSISLRANPQYSSHCFYVADQRSYPMKTDYRFEFYNDLVKIRVNDGLKITAQLTELRTGAHARCSE